MAEAKRHHGKYDHTIVTVSELIWGEGFLAPGGAAAETPRFASARASTSTA